MVKPIDADELIALWKEVARRRAVASTECSEQEWGQAVGAFHRAADVVDTLRFTTRMRSDGWSTPAAPAEKTLRGRGWHDAGRPAKIPL